MGLLRILAKGILALSCRGEIAPVVYRNSTDADLVDVQRLPE